MTTTITLTLPLPPMALSKNARVHWRVRARAFKAHKELAFGAMREQFAVVPQWPGATLHIDWFQCWPGCDDDNALARVAAFRDGVAGSGLVADDRLIRIGSINVERVRTKKEQRVVLRFEKREAA
jgi:crossover junction endodeoxyribonuclease RusA